MSVSSGAISLSVDDVGQKRKLFAVTTPSTSPSLQETTFEQINVTSANYFIISHQQLMQNASDGIDPVQAYADYRSADYNVAVFEIHDLYNQYNYGDPSALAIKNLMKEAVSLGNPEYLFLIGKTSDLKAAYYRTANPSIPVLVPTYGVPGSDALFTTGLKDAYVPAVPTGRLSAYNSEDVKNYLDKVKEMEALSYDELWRKHVLLLSGGKDALELSLFLSFVNGFKSVAESDFLGGKDFYQKEGVIRNRLH